MKETGGITRLTATESFGMLMATSMMATGNRTRPAATAYTHMQTVLDTRGSGMMICKMARARRPGLMAQATRVCT